MEEPSNRDGDSLYRRTTRKNEMAFFAIESCDMAFSSVINPPMGEWMDVHFVKGDRSERQISCSPCENCILSFFDSTQGRLELFLESIPTFQGSSKDLDLSCSSCGRSMRTDASLLLDLLRFCAPIVSIETCRIFRIDKTRGALLTTVSFPNLFNGVPGRRSILQKFAKRNERLHPALQMALSICRSDWDFLKCFESGMKRMFELKELPASNQTRPFFPSVFSMEEMYSRVNGSSTLQQLVQEQHDLLGNQEHNENCCLVQLSPEILADHIAPYLRAPSLNALRSTCSYVHTSLRSVVPGLKLRLYNHQVKSLAWMRSREAKQLTETDLMRLPRTSPHAVDGDAHRAATGGLTTLLASRPTSSATTTIRISQLTGNEVAPQSATSGSLDRDVARGGLLCDDPGLGKTITVLSLLLQTSGMLPSLEFLEQHGEVNENDLFQAYWSEDYLVPEQRRPPLLKILNSFLRSERELLGLFSVDRIRDSIDSDCYEEFPRFEQDIETCIGTFFATEEDTRERLCTSFRNIVQEFKRSECSTARKSFSSVSAKPNSRVAALVDQDRKAKLLKSFVPSRATLLVVPSVLMDHWEEQILQHVDLDYMTSKIPLLFRFGEGSTMSVDVASQLLRERKSHAPVLFLDRGGTSPLPAPEFLAQFHIVLTTSQRFINEWSNGSFQQEVRRKTFGDKFQNLIPPTEACPLQKVYWHRMIIDEGHSMAKDRETSFIQFASWIPSERRWAMTGTPTKQKTTNLKQIKALIRFLGHDYFNQRCGGDVFWKEALEKNWKSGMMAAFFRLRSLLQLLMKRHTKSDIEELPAPLFRESIIPMSMIEVNTYNTLVSGVQSNILITSMTGKTSGEQDSLLHKNNAKHARAALENLRRVCVGWSRVVPTLEGRFYAETMALSKGHGLDLVPIRAFINRAENELLSECAVCSIRLSILLLMPCCGGLICTECMDGKSNQCLNCGDEFDVDDFQRLQPGFALTWKSNLDVRKQASTHQAVEVARNNERPAHGDLQINRNVVQTRRRTNKFGDGHVCQYKDEDSNFRGDCRCTRCWVEHASCNLMNTARCCGTCGRQAEDCPEDESKAAYLVNKLQVLYSLHASQQRDRPLKVIVFSQFRKALNVVGSRLLNRFGTACVAEYWGKIRRQELHKFTHEDDCFCLLLTKDGSEGLDLSFVTHIFFLEEIWDKALEKQAVARAWRMGATGRVEVETLIAQNSVEETMRHSIVTKQPSSSVVDRSRNGPRGQAEQQQSKTKSLLLSLRFITDYRTFAKPQDSKPFEDESLMKRRLPNFEWLSQGKAVTAPQKKRPRKVLFHLPEEIP